MKKTLLQFALLSSVCCMLNSFALAGTISLDAHSSVSSVYSQVVTTPEFRLLPELYSLDVLGKDTISLTSILQNQRMTYRSATIAAPSAEMQSALDKTLLIDNEQELTLHEQAQKPFSRVDELGIEENITIGIEYDDNQPVWKNKFKVKTGTMRQQLDTMAARTGYIWQAIGDSIYLFPKSKSGDTKYPLNWKIEGDIILSRTPFATPMKSWFAQHGLSSMLITSGQSTH